MIANAMLKPPVSYVSDEVPAIRVIQGPGSLHQLGAAARDLNGRRALLVTDQGLIRAGHVQVAQQVLEQAGLSLFTFTDVEENPTTACVEKCARFARNSGDIDLIIGLGGGSSLDCAKGVNFLLSNGGKMEDYWGKNLATKPMLPSIGIPTTAGTGSEAQSYALISQAETHRKMACGDLKARFRVVILDPQLVQSVPSRVAAYSGMDAITHALEAYVTANRSPLSQGVAADALALLVANFEKVLKDPSDIQAWGSMQLGAHYAGVAIEASMLGAAHACANPLTARFDVPHGVAVALMLPHVMNFNREIVGGLYQELARKIEIQGTDLVGQLIARLVGLRHAARMPGHLQHFAIEEEHLPDLAQDATQQWTGTFNPRPLGYHDYLGLYRNALNCHP